MTNREIAAVALKVFAIYILTHLLIGLPGIYGIYIAARAQIGVHEVPLIPLLLVAGVYVAAFFLARGIWKLSNSVLESAGEPKAERLPDNTAEFLIVVVGLFIAIEAIFTFPSAAYDALREMTTHGRSGGLSGATFVWGLSEFLKLILGITLVIKPRGWIALLRRLRTLGQES